MVVPARPAVEKGFKYLATRQQEDGAFSNSGYGRNAAVVALAGMAWLAGGSTPGRGPYGAEVGKVSEYLLDHCEQSGFISVEGAQSHGPMYEHGFATLFLAEVYGMSPRDDMRDKLARAVDLDCADAKRGGRVAVSAAARGCGYFGDDLPGDGAAGGAQCGAEGAE